MRVVRIVSGVARVLTDGYRIIITATASVYLIRELFSMRGHARHKEKARGAAEKTKHHN